MNFDFVICEDSKITLKKRSNQIKTTLTSQKSFLKKLAYGYAAKD